MWVDGKGFNKAAASLASARPQPEPDLASALTKSISSRIQRIEDTLSYILKNDGKERTSKDAIREMQFLHDFGDRNPEGGYNLKDPAMRRLLKENTRLMATEWKPKIAVPPFSRWKERAQHLQRSKCGAHALQTFDSVGRDITYLEKVVSAACAALDAHIDYLIDLNKEGRVH